MKSTNKTVFEVFDCGKPAKYPECKVDPSWSNNKFDTWEEAKEYALDWLGVYGHPELSLEPNAPYDYNGCGDLIEIRSVETRQK